MGTSPHRSLFVVLFVTLVLRQANSANCPNPAEEGGSTIIMFTVPDASSTSSSFTWLAMNNIQDLVTCCTGNKTCITTTGFGTYPTGRFSSSPSQITLELNISGVTRSSPPFNMETEWRLLDDRRHTVYSCDLIVYKKPSNVSCDQPRFSGDNSSVSVTCETDRVYPQALCQFYRKSSAWEPGNPIDNTGVQYSHTEVTSSSVKYYRSSCTQTVPLSSLQAGDITFTVNMYPEFPGSDTSYGITNVGSPVSITLSYPTVTITSCPVVVDSANNYKGGYIREGATFTCQCNLAHSGNPTGEIDWLNNTGHIVATGNMLPNGIAKPGETFTCRGTSPIGIGYNPLAKETYSPNVAHGPTQVTVSLGDGHGKSRTLCPLQNLSIPVVCQTPLVNINPKPRCSILVTKSGLTSYTEDFSTDQGQVQTEQYTFSSDVPVTEAGDYVVTCTMYNSVFGDLTHSDSIELSVTDPVISHPVFTVNGIVRDEQIVHGDNVTVTCSDTGVIGEGFELLCTNNSVSISQHDEDKIEFLSIRTADNGTVCVCNFSSTQGCLLEGTKTLRVTSTPSTSALGGGDSDFPTTAVAVAVAVIVVVVVVVLIAVLLIKRRKQRRRSSKLGHHRTETISKTGKGNQLYDDMVIVDNSELYGIPGDETVTVDNSELYSTSAHTNGTIDHEDEVQDEFEPYELIDKPVKVQKSSPGTTPEARSAPTTTQTPKQKKPPIAPKPAILSNPMAGEKSPQQTDKVGPGQHLYENVDKARPTDSRDLEFVGDVYAVVNRKSQQSES
ncbi:uncharacterized protein LOC101850593 [Aplysia californica]|uniref:Uncharacterized protein LOC101850593 n=1 Tax=Aplysia californica TaxID=6500 RepID=A0ABM1A842_APLCA|nr:uncharacterized protein LOC101850593 [Aplysia californica]